jgi:hypothetical protein
MPRGRYRWGIVVIVAAAAAAAAAAAVIDRKSIGPSRLLPAFC